MKVYKKSDKHLLTDHWNKSPVEIGLSRILSVLTEKERLRSHNYYEYYVILNGSLKLEINKQVVQAKKEMVVMVEPKEKHRIVWIDPKEGAKWVTIKQKSAPRRKTKRSSK